MLIPCEIAVKGVIPVIRAMLAKELLFEYNLKQLKVANLLGVSQSAVSLYNKKIRGKALDLETEKEIKAEINDMAAKLVKDEITYKNFIIQLCNVCKLIRKNGLMCELHKAFDPKIDLETCKLCMESASKHICK